MNWEQLIISQKSSKSVKQVIDTTDGCKYIGVIPIYWNLNLNTKTKNNNSNSNNQDEKDMDIDMDVDMDIDVDDNSIMVINTSKSKTLISREFYYLEKDSVNYYPVYKFLNDKPFTLREIKHKMYQWLSDDGFDFKENEVNEDDIEIFRIYKMMGFHLFVCLFNKKIVNNHNNHNNPNNPNNVWKSDKGVELLNLENGEITNSFMKIINSKFQQKSNNLVINSIWNMSLNGYSRCENIIPYSIKWDEIIATLANLIDKDAKENRHLYFIPNIIDISNHYNDISNLSKSMSEPASDIWS
jgi:hypothetical protein